MTTPDKSMKVLKEIVYRYVKISGYKINEAKSTGFGINVDEGTRRYKNLI